MTADIVNLRATRRQKKRVDTAKAAQANREKFGRTKSQKQIEANARARAERTLDQAALDGVSDDGEPTIAPKASAGDT